LKELPDTNIRSFFFFVAGMATDLEGDFMVTVVVVDFVFVIVEVV
jgi:hypothetical protein